MVIVITRTGIIICALLEISNRILFRRLLLDWEGEYSKSFHLDAVNLLDAGPFYLRWYMMLALSLFAHVTDSLFPVQSSMYYLFITAQVSRSDLSDKVKWANVQNFHNSELKKHKF